MASKIPEPMKIHGCTCNPAVAAWRAAMREIVV
jgi:hypothetical protein